MSWQRVMKERRENQRKRETPSDLLGRVLRRTTHIRSWYAQLDYKWKDIDPYYLKWLFKDEERREILLSPYFDNKSFFRYLDYNTAGQQSVKVYVTGWPGTGKTTLAQQVCCLTLDRVLKREVTVDEAYGLNGHPKNLFHVFGLARLAAVYEQDLPQPGNITLSDDLRFKEGPGSKKVVWRVANLAHNLRFDDQHMVIVSSKALHITEINPFCTLQIAGKLHKTQETVALVYLGDNLDSKIKLKIRDPQGFWDAALAAKTESVREIKLAGGKATVDIDGPIPDRAKLIFTPGKIREFIIANCGKGKLTTILKEVFRGKRQRIIAELVGITQGKLSEKITKFGESRLGYIVEEYFRNKFGDKRDFSARASQGTPDVITKDGEVLSVKGHINYKKSQIIYPLIDCRPELDAGDKFKIIYVNPIWSDGYMEFEVDSKHPPNWVSFFKDGRVDSG